MRQRKNYAAIDNFRLVAALLIVAIHTGPLESFHSTADFLVTYCVGRIAVPFFLMVTGFFVLAPYQKSMGRSSYQAEKAAGKLWKFLKKTALLYGAAILLYLPVMIYAKQWNNSPGEWLKEIFFDGTFYHLWYLPAVLTGCILLAGLLSVCNPPVISLTVLVLYIIGTGGDSYYGLLSQALPVKIFYEGIFTVSSYTRNGIFFAPMFLWMGVIIANGKIRMSGQTALTGFLISMAGMMGEGLLSFSLEWQKHNSMYLLLPVVMFFLFELLLSAEGTFTIPMVRDVSMCVYIIHPICIILVRGLAGGLKLTDIFVEQSLIHYLTVCALSLVLSSGIALGMQAFRNRADAAPGYFR